MTTVNVFIRSKQGEKSMFEERILKAKMDGDRVLLFTESGETKRIKGFIEEIDLAEDNLIIFEIE